MGEQLVRFEEDHQPYELTSFAQRHGLSVTVADAVLFAKGPSRTACDAAATAFLCAVAEYAKRQAAR
jgi:hypothetical protein